MMPGEPVGLRDRLFYEFDLEDRTPGSPAWFQLGYRPQMDGPRRGRIRRQPRAVHNLGDLPVLGWSQAVDAAISPTRPAKRFPCGNSFYLPEAVEKEGMKVQGPSGSH